MADDLPYQQAPAVAQLLAERANADTYGQGTRVEAIDKQLKQLGYSTAAKAVKAATAADARAEAAVEDDDEGAKSEPPKGRSTPQQHQHVATKGSKSKT